MNNTESAFEREYLLPRKLAGEIADYWFEAWTFKLADNCRYTPDFVAQDADGWLTAYEVKGTTTRKVKVGRKEVPYVKDDAAVKTRIFPLRFPLQLLIAWKERATKQWITAKV